MRAVNLIPAEQREGAGGLTGRSGGGALIVLGLLAGLAVLAFLYGKSEHSISSSRNELAAANTELTAARAQVGRLAPYTTFIASANQRAQEVSQLVASRFDWSHTFAELGRVLPRAAALTTLTGTVGSGASGAATPTSARHADGGRGRRVRHAARQHPQLRAQRLRHEPVGGRADAPAAAPDGRRRRSDAADVDQVRRRSGERSSSAGSGAAGGCPPNGATFSAQVSFQPLPASSTTPAGPGASTATGTPASTGAGQAGAVPVSSAGGGTSR